MNTKTKITKEGIKEIVKIYLKGRDIKKEMSPYEYNGLRNFISKNTKDSKFEKVSNEKLMSVLSSLNIEVRK